MPVNRFPLMLPILSVSKCRVNARQDYGHNHRLLRQCPQVELTAEAAIARENT
jgi:hypothetical protein